MSGSVLPETDGAQKIGSSLKADGRPQMSDNDIRKKERIRKSGGMTKGDELQEMSPRRKNQKAQENQPDRQERERLLVRGTIVKGIAGFYYVDTGSVVYECKARGVFKKDSRKPYVGDEVLIDIVGETPVICEIGERMNVFERPPVANVEQFVIVSAFEDPAPNLAIVDRFLTMAESKEMDVIVCFNKADLAEENEKKRMELIYGGTYPLVFVEALNGEGIDELIPYLKDRKSALAGPSGVGKSTIMNALIEGLGVETGSVSEKTKRGRHTTRHVELFKLNFGGMIFDTPGFTSFDVPPVEEMDLQHMFREFEAYLGRCHFVDCCHQNEPDCAVREAVDAGRIPQSRYQSYLSQLAEIRERERKKYL